MGDIECDRKISDDDVKNAFEKLKKHPFTIISLSDREKFHTGMLSYIFNMLQRNEQEMLIDSLWGEDTSQNLDKGKPLICDVEHNSIDLIITQATDANQSGKKASKAKIVLWAEMKFKTTLSVGQLPKYKEKLSDAVGALFALFIGVEQLPDGIQEVRFQNKIIAFNKKYPLTEYILDPKAIVLIDLWLDYLAQIQILTDYTCKTQLAAMWEGFEPNIHSLKLKGIFEHYRYMLFRKAVWDELSKEQFNASNIVSHIYNSNGNAGIGFNIPIAEIRKNYTHTDKYKDHMLYGLGWQHGSLKIGIDTEKPTYYTTPLNHKKALEERDTNLNMLYNQFKEKNWVESSAYRKRRPNTKYSSYTIKKWDIFDSIEQQRVRDFVQYLSFLNSDECRDKIIDESNI